MIATVDNMTENFKIYNKLYFEGRLPLPKFEVMHTYRMSGYFIFDPVKKGRIRHKKIYMTDYFDFTEEMYRNVLVHEMIHYYIAYNKITRKIDASSFKRNEKASKISWFFTKLFGC